MKIFVLFDNKVDFIFFGSAQRKSYDSDLNFGSAERKSYDSDLNFGSAERKSYVSDLNFRERRSANHMIQI